MASPVSKRHRQKVLEAPANKKLVVGFVCEGSTDIIILRRIAEELLGDIDFRTLQPATDALDRQGVGGAAGWSEVRAWCQRVEAFDDIFDPFIGDPIDLLVIAIDLDIAIRAGVQKPQANLKAYDAKELCKIVKGWLPSPIPDAVVIAIPVMALESWILAATFPGIKAPELEAQPAQVLVDRKKIEMGRNGPWKRAVEYRPFAEQVAKKLKKVREKCAEAERYAAKIERIAARLA